MMAFSPLKLNWPEGASSDSSHSHVASQKPLAGLVQNKESLGQAVRVIKTYQNISKRIKTYCTVFHIFSYLFIYGPYG